LVAIRSDRIGGLSAQQVIDGVLRRYLADGSLDPDDADEVRSVVLLRMAQLGRADIRSAEDYVAMMTHNAARDVFRGRDPGRARLRKRVRAIVREDARFVAGDAWCALRGHAGWPAATIDLTAADYAAARALPLAEVVALVLRRAGGAIAFDQLVDCVIDVTGIALDGRTVPLDDDPPADEPGLDERLVARETLAALWDEIGALPLPQRAALLLHLRDDRGASAIPLLVFTGTATLDEIAAALELGRPRMERLWDELPLPDAGIASLLETTAARVVGLRRAARERLGRMLRRRG
jgi:hypothetical protein